jgi:hypothetical protein
MEVPGRQAQAAGKHAIGAYGLRLQGVDAAADVLVPASAGWPEVTVSAEEGRASLPLDSVSEARASLRLRNGGAIQIDRRSGTAVVRTPDRITAHELVHPYLAPIAAVLARWLGRESFHAGGFAVGGGVWAVLGEREAGKSTTLAWLAGEGLPIVCDDMLVVGDEGVHAAPRVLDLRQEAAERFEVGEALGVVGARERWRVRLASAPDGLPLRGWIFLSWDDRISISRVPGSQRLARLAPQLGLRVPPRRPEVFLDLISLPAWELRRPRGWDSLGEAGRRLVETAAG